MAFNFNRNEYLRRFFGRNRLMLIFELVAGVPNGVQNSQCERIFLDDFNEFSKTKQFSFVKLEWFWSILRIVNSEVHGECLSLLNTMDLPIKCNQKSSPTKFAVSFQMCLELMMPRQMHRSRIFEFVPQNDTFHERNGEIFKHPIDIYYESKLRHENV